MIAEGSSKLASVPSGGSGGGAAPAAGGAASGGAAAEEKEEEKKEEGMLRLLSLCWISTNVKNREGGIRRGYGFRSLRLSSQHTSPWILHIRYSNESGQGFWEKLCELFCHLHIISIRLRKSGLFMTRQPLCI